MTNCYGLPLSLNKFREFCLEYFEDIKYVHEQCNALALYFNCKFDLGYGSGPYIINKKYGVAEIETHYDFEEIKIIAKLNKRLKKYDMVCAMNSVCCVIDARRPILIYTEAGDCEYNDSYSDSDNIKSNYDGYVKIIQKKDSVKIKVNNFFKKYLPTKNPFHFYVTGHSICSCT